MKEGGNPLKTPSVMRMGPPRHQSQQTAEEKTPGSPIYFQSVKRINKSDITAIYYKVKDENTH